ncbi:MAG: ribonuclease D, partial [Pseudomonadota bacterium]
MQLVTKQSELDSLPGLFAGAPYLTIDTEFIRERTYWPRLCLVQIAQPVTADAPDCAWLIDPLAELDLEPLFDLLRNANIAKVFHAARQDVEIFVHLTGEVPRSIVDTQVAAMVCGYGDQVGYETLVRKIANASIDKSSRFTDWSRRPLSEKQLRYAAADVTYLRNIHERLSQRLEETGRAAWVASEMETLTSIDTYVVKPEDA